MIVVADASVLIGLSSIGKLSLLQDRFPEGVVIPSAVWQEVVVQGKTRSGASEVANADWITVRAASDQDIVRLLKMDLEDGEAEAIALAKELQAHFVLLDERDARRRAKELGLPVLGTIGILIWAKRTGKIDNLQNLLDTMQNIANFRISAILYDHALREVGE
jgi:predicted nucleic acid-binding protein